MARTLPQYDLNMTSPLFDYSVRLERARAAMAASGLDGLMLSVGSDLPYLTGYEAMPLERVTMLVMTEGETVLVVPELEAPRVPEGPFDVRPFSETVDPIRVIADIAGNVSRVGVGDQTWAMFLLRIQGAMSQTAFESATPVTTGLRVRKDAHEIDLLRRAAHATDRVAARLAETSVTGLTEAALSRQVGRWTVEEGHDIDTFRIVAAGPNAASPHHEPTNRLIQRGDMVVVDFGGRLSGYCSDTTRTFVVGEPSDEQAEVHEVVRLAQKAAVESVAPGAIAADIDAAARRVISEAGYGDFFIHRTGHGIGLDVHEEPYIVETSRTMVETGMAFSIEPGIYLQGRFGVRIEDIVVVTDTGVEQLNRSDRSLISIE